MLEAHGEPGTRAGRAGLTELNCGGPRATPSRARSPRSRKPGEEIAGETGRREDTAPTPCGRGAGFPGSRRHISFPGETPQLSGPGLGGSLLSSCGLRNDQARRWRPGTAARRPGWPRGRPKARGPAPPRRLPGAPSRVEVRVEVAPGSCGHSRPGTFAQPGLPGPTYSLRLGGAGAGAAAARSRRAGLPPADPPARSAGLATRGCPPGPPPQGRPLPERCLPAECAILGIPAPLSRNSRCADWTWSLRAQRRNACPRKGGGGESREERERRSGTWGGRRRRWRAGKAEEGGEAGET